MGFHNVKVFILYINKLYENKRNSEGLYEYLH